MRLSFTGSRRFSPLDYHLAVRPILDGLPAFDEYTYGGAPGIDQFVQVYMMQQYPGALHRIILPRLRPNTESHHAFAELMEERARGSEYEDSLVVIRTQLSPPARNPLIVSHGDLLVGFPYHEESRDIRSGTWATIRIARRRGVPYSVHILEPK